MNKLESMKQIASRRTPGEWQAVDSYVRGPSTMILANEQDASFIAMAANNIDKLLRCAEILKECKEVYAKIKERSLIGQRDLYKWYQDEADLFYPIFQAIDELEK